MPVFVTFILLVITAIAMWFISPELLIGLGIGSTLGIALLTTLLRNLGNKAKKSPCASELFYKITNCKVTIYNIPRQQPATIQATIYGEGHDNADLEEVLKSKQLGFTASTAKEAARHAMNEARGLPLPEKIRVALQYVGNANQNTMGGD